MHSSTLILLEFNNKKKNEMGALVPPVDNPMHLILEVINLKNYVQMVNNNNEINC